VINNDSEQSPGNAAAYLGSYEEYQELSRVAVHGIAGDVPGGCSSDGGGAVPSAELYDATQRTGGAYVSICEEDWTKLAPVLVTSFSTHTNAAVAFPFPEYPAVESIDVYIDDDEALTGWWYELKSNTLVFDQPPTGSALRVEYVGVESCW
jgi:hypothetical protein